jgi:hypothetical protein
MVKAALPRVLSLDLTIMSNSRMVPAHVRDWYVISPESDRAKRALRGGAPFGDPKAPALYVVRRDQAPRLDAPEPAWDETVLVRRVRMLRWLASVVVPAVLTYQAGRVGRLFLADRGAGTGIAHS